MTPLVAAKSMLNSRDIRSYYSYKLKGDREKLEFSGLSEGKVSQGGGQNS